MNTAQFWALSHLIHQEECAAEGEENAAGVLFYVELQEALCALMLQGVAEYIPASLRPNQQEVSAARAHASILLQSQVSRAVPAKELPQVEDKVLQFGELQALYKKVLPRSVSVPRE